MKTRHSIVVIVAAFVLGCLMAGKYCRVMEKQRLDARSQQVIDTINRGMDLWESR